MSTPTPRTDEAWAAWAYAGSGMSVHVGRELERELTAAREEIKELNDKLDDAVADATNAVNDIIRMKWQRDRLAEAMQTIIRIYENADKGCIPSSSDMYDEALQSLTTTEP